jgi:SOS-response transcriptional repressor LexA
MPPAASMALKRGVFASVLTPSILDRFSVPASFSVACGEQTHTMSIHKTIREGRRAKGLSQQELAELCGVTRSAVQQWEQEDGTAPKRAQQSRVASVLGLTVAQLMGASNVQAGPEVRGSVPLISAVQAGNYKMHVDNFHPDDGGEERVLTTVPVKRHTFALRVAGDSMEPDFKEGAILIVEPDMEAHPGDFVISKNEDGETTFKQLVKDGGDWYLKPLNSRYPMKALGKSSIVGVVRAVERRFR